MAGRLKASTLGIIPDSGVTSDISIAAGEQDCFSISGAFTSDILNKPFYLGGAAMFGQLLNTIVIAYINNNHIILRDKAAVTILNGKAQWGTDWTNAITAAMGSLVRGGEFEFDDIGYYACSVNMTKKVSTILSGISRGLDNPQTGTVLLPVPGRNCIIDWTSAYGVVARHMQVGSHQSPIQIPNGIQSLWGSQPVGDVLIEDVHVAGMFSNYGLAAYGPNNSRIVGSQFSNSCDIGAPAGFISLPIVPLASEWDIIDTLQHGVGAWRFYGSGFSQHPFSIPSLNGISILLHGAANMLFSGCEFDTSSQNLGNIYLASAPNRNCTITMEACLLYSEANEYPPKYNYVADGGYGGPHTVWDRSTLGAQGGNSYAYGTGKSIGNVQFI